MGTYSDLQTNIANDLTRSDLSSQIQSAIGDAIALYEHDRFWFNTTRSLTFNTVAGQSTYTAADLSQIPNIIRLDKLFIRYGVSTFPLTRYEPDEYEVIAGLNTTNGIPTVYTYDDGQILLWAPPNAAYTIRPHMHYRLAPLVNGTDTNAWCNEAERLIRAQAKQFLYTNVLEDDEGMQRMQLEIPAIKAKLDYETSARSATGRIRTPPGNF